MKVCIRCRGDMVLATTEAGPELKCLQCGFYLDQKRAVTLIQRQRQRKLPVVA